MSETPSGRLSRAAALVGILLLLAGCGIRPQDRPGPVSVVVTPSTGSGTEGEAAGWRLAVFFVRGADLMPVERRASDETPGAALDVLVEGPTRAEANQGIRTALTPEPIVVERYLPDGTVTVSVDRGFTGLTGGSQLLAVAQVVWTLTEVPRVSAVRFDVEGTPVEIPTDDGLVARPVDRDDYRSVAPAPPRTKAPATDDGAAPTG